MISRAKLCPRDGFPIVEIDGQLHCSVEYADGLIGGQRVLRARERDGYLYLEFEAGTSIPLTCPCCGGRLHLRSMSFDQLGAMLSGRALEGFRHGEWVGRGRGAGRHPIFALQFAGEEDLSARTIQVHLVSVQRIENGSAKPGSSGQLP
jgi:hypothetical protein